MSRTIVAITGASGYLGKLLVPTLQKDRKIERIIGFDVQPLIDPPKSKKFEFVQTDVRDPGIVEAIKGADVLIHMAFKLWRLPDSEDLEEINIRGSYNVFDAAVQAKVKKLIFTSSTVAYGIRADNPMPLTEEHPLRPNEKLYYSWQKAACEKRLHEIQKKNPEIRITILRPCAVAGPNAPPNQFDAYISDPAIVVRGFDPPAQLVHEADVIQALRMAIHNDLPGIYNVTADETQSLRQATQSRGGRVLALPLFIIKPLLWLLWRTGKTIAAPEWILMSLYPFIASNDKLRAEGWKPKYTTPAIYDSIVEAFGKPS
jgi:UDP-glucose 4-epimerase